MKASASACTEADANEHAEDVQTIQDGTCNMQTDILNQLDNLPPESRAQLSKQIQRVQSEARKLRAEARRVRRAQRGKLEKTQGVFQQFTPGRSQGTLKRGSELVSSGASMVGSLPQTALEQGNSLIQGLGQYGSQATQNLADWRDATTDNLRKQGLSLTRNASDWRDETTHQARKRSRHLSRMFADWFEEMLYQLRKQGRSLAQSLNDQKEDTAHQARKRGRHLSHTLADRKDDAMHQLSKQGRNVTRTLSDRKDDAAHQLHKQKRSLTRSRDDISQRMRVQSQQLIKSQRNKPIWSLFGFLAGFVLAGGITIWLIRRAFRERVEEEARQIELPPQQDNLNGAIPRPGGEIRYMGQGGTAVATRPDVETASRTETSGRAEPAYNPQSMSGAGSTTRFVGVLSTRRYYPIEQKPDAPDLIFFTSESEARAEGYTAAL
jgi:hypothetical protein